VLQREIEIKKTVSTEQSTFSPNLWPFFHNNMVFPAGRFLVPPPQDARKVPAEVKILQEGI